MLAKIDSGKERERIAAKGRGRRECAKGRMRERKEGHIRENPCKMKDD